MKHGIKILIFILFPVFLSFIPLNKGICGYKFEFVTVSDVVKKIRARFSGIDSYQADFVIISERGKTKTRQSGKMSYKRANRMAIEFREPYGQKIVSDGRKMWLYIPSMNVVAEQDLKDESGTLFSTGTSAGLRRLFTKYHYKFASKNQPEIQQDGSKVYTLALAARESRGGFRSLNLWVSDDYLIKKVSGETTTGKTVVIDFSNIKTDIDLPGGLFKFDTPSRAKIIKNPFVSEE